MKKQSTAAVQQDGPVARVVRNGIRGAGPIDLLSVAISDSEDTAAGREDTARALLKNFGIHNLGGVSRSEIQELTELDEYASLRFLAALELGRRAGQGAKGEIREIRNADDIAALFDYLKDETKEHFCVALLNAKNGVIGVRTVHIGTVNMSVVGPREVYREAVREGAVSIVVVHNHPSGNPEPSDEDINITQRLASVGRMLDIPLLDHVIIGHHEFTSLSRRNLI